MKTSTNCMIYEWHIVRVIEGGRTYQKLLSFNFIQFLTIFAYLQHQTFSLLRQTNTLHSNKYFSFHIIYAAACIFCVMSLLFHSACVYVLNSHLIEITCAWNWSIVYAFRYTFERRFANKKFFRSLFLHETCFQFLYAHWFYHHPHV